MFIILNLWSYSIYVCHFSAGSDRLDQPSGVAGRVFAVWVGADYMANGNVTYTSDNTVYVLDNNDFYGSFMNTTCSPQ